MKNHKISYLIVSLMALLLGIGAHAQTTCYVVNETKEYTLKLGDKSSAIVLDGPGKTVTFQAKRQFGALNYGFTLQVSTDNGANWSDSGGEIKVGTGYEDKSYEISSNVTHIRFSHVSPGDLKKYVRNVKVTRATTLSSSTASIDFGTLVGVGASLTKTISVDYNNTLNPTQLTGSCTDGQFTVTGRSMDETGKADISVTYKPTAVGNHSGKVTLTMGSATYEFTVNGSFTGNCFKFGASAQSSNTGFGSASASVANAEIHNTSSSASTTATFTATPANGCTFNGWYDNSNYSGTPVSTSATYQVTLTNNTVNSTVSKTLYAKFKKNQTLSWNNSFDAYTIINGTTVANPASASSGLAVAYTSSNTDAITVDADGTLHGVSLGKSTITASQAGSNDYNPATSISREFSVLDKLQPVFTPSFSGTQAALKVGENVTVGLTDVTEGFSISAATPDIVSWTRSGNTVTVTALKEGATTLTFNDPGNAITNPASASYTISVSKIENTLAVNMASLETTVGGTLAVTFSGRNNNDTPIEVALSNQVFSSSVNSGSSVISYSDGIVTALNAGTATITFSQAATGKYTAAVQKNFDVIVAKNGNSISVTIDGQQRNSINLGRNVSVPVSYTSASDAQFSVVMTSGSESIASISGSSIVTHDTDGTVIWSISQPETYKYEAAISSVRVKVNSTAEAEGYVLDDNTEYSHGTGSGVIHQYALSGPGEILSYSVKRDWSAIYYDMYVEWSADGQNWEQLDDNTSIPDSKYADFQHAIPENARYVRFRFPGGGTLRKYIRNVKVTRKTYVRASSDKTDLGTVNTGSTAAATITVDWSSTNGGDIAIESSNPNFTFSPAAVTGTANKDGKTAVTVTYTPDPAKLGADEATITVSDLFYSQELKLTATAAKQGTSITKNYDDSAASSLKVDGAISNAFKFSGVSSATPSSSQDADFYYVIDQHVSGNAEGSSHPDMVIAYDPATNKVTALNAGTATITIYQKSTALYLATNASFAFAVAKHDQTIAWDNEISDFTLKKGQSLEINTATASSELPVTYSSSNTLSITVDAATGKLTAVGAGADVEITAAQNGNYKYNPVSISRKFTVFAQSAPVFTPSFEGSVTAMKVDESFTISLENISDGLEGDFTVTASTEGILRWSRQDNVLTIKALDEGTVILTLAQKGNDDYLAKTAEYTVTVTLPDDYAVLNPDGQLPAAGEYRKITLKRTIPAGLSTVALPFTTSLAALVSGTSNGNAKAYILRNVGVDSEKGYVFYFKEVESGQLSAGIPYVIFLENEIKNPVWTSQEGIQLSGNAGTVTCGAWSITANFEAGKAMNGLYGVVNTPEVNNIMLGGAGSTLNAYSAYIIEEDVLEEETKASMGVTASNEGLVPLFTIAVK